MRGLAAILRRELYAFFASPIFYVVGAIFLVLSGYFFYTAVVYFNLISFQAAQNPSLGGMVNLQDMVLKPLLDDMSIILLLMVPLLTMRLFSEEKKNGTIELLLTYPLKEWSIVLGKYLATLLILGVLLGLTMVYLLLLSWIGDLEWGVVLSGYAGLLLLVSGFVSLGLFVSSLTQNQIVAAALSFGALLMFWVIGWIGSVSGPGVNRVVTYFSLTDHLDSFTKGVVDTRDILFFVNFSLFFLFLTLRYLDSRKIRG